MKKHNASLEDYLYQVVRWVFSAHERKNIQMELRSHLEDSIDEKCAGGLERQAAIDSALQEMGSARRIALKLGWAHRPLILRGPFTLSFLSIGLLGCFVSMTMATADYFKAVGRHQDKIVKTYLGRFLEDEKILSRLPAFAFSENRKDAGPYLNSQVSWLGSENKENAPFFANLSPLKLEEGIRKNLNGKNWLEADIDVNKIDTAWMSRLPEFDHWDIFGSGPLARILELRSHQIFESLPVPDYFVLQAWVKVRMLQGIRDGHPGKAFREAHALARLIYSNQLLASSAVYVSLLNLEREAAPFARRVGDREMNTWPVLSQEEITRARRVVFAFQGVFDLWTDPGTLSRVLDGKIAKAGLCSAVQEKIFSLGVSRLFYENNPFFAAEFSAKFKNVSQILEQANSYCRISPYLVKLWKHPEGASWMSPENFSFLAEDSLERLKWIVLPRIPFVQTWMGARLEQMTHSDYLTGPYTRYLLADEEKLQESF